MKFRVHAKVSIKMKNFSFTVFLDRGISSMEARHLEELKSCTAELFSLEIASISVFTSKDGKKKSKNDLQLVEHMMRSPYSARIVVAKNGKKKKNSVKSQKQERKRGNVFGRLMLTVTGSISPVSVISLFHPNPSVKGPYSSCNIAAFDGYTVKPGMEVPEAILERGDSGDEMKLLHKHLENLGSLL